MCEVSQSATWKDSKKIPKKEEAFEQRKMVDPPVNSQRFFLSEERGCSHDSGEILKSRVKRAGGSNFRTYYKKESFQITSKKA